MQTRQKKSTPVRREPARSSQALKQFRKKEHLFDKTPSAAQQQVVQPKYNLNNFPDDNKINILYSTLKNSGNNILQFFNTGWASMDINLDKTVDENPGDATSYMKKQGETKWSRVDLDYIRQGGKIDALHVVVNIREWFYHKYSAGKLLSMAAHEIGVHISPYMNEYVSAMPAGAQHAFGFNQHQIIDTTKTHGKRGFNDHQRVANINHEDFIIYRDTVNDLINSLLISNKKYLGENEAELEATELADAYLMDISTFMGSGNRWPVPVFPGTIAKRYNSYRGQDPQLVRKPGKKTGRHIISDYADLYQKVLPVAIKHHPYMTAFAALLVLTVIYFFTRLFI